MVIDGTNISLVRGDVAILTVVFESGVELIDFDAGDEIYFTVKKNISTKEIAIQKITDAFAGVDTVDYQIEHKDTKDLSYGKYVYDIRLFKDGKPFRTLIDYSPFNITGEVSHGQ